MTQGGPMHLTLHISNKDVYETTTPIGWVADTMADLEYLYNILSIPDLIEHGGIPNYSLQPLGSFLSARDLPLQITGSLIRRLIPQTAQAQLEAVQVGSSFTIKFGGLAKAIDALARIFDPARRTAQRADDQHRERMNWLEEEDKLTEVVRRRLEVVAQYIDDPRFDEFGIKELGHHGHAELKDNMIRGTRSAITNLGRNETEVVDVDVESA